MITIFSPPRALRFPAVSSCGFPIFEGLEILLKTVPYLGIRLLQARPIRLRMHSHSPLTRCINSLNSTHYKIARLAKKWTTILIILFDDASLYGLGIKTSYALNAAELTMVCLIRSWNKAFFSKVSINMDQRCRLNEVAMTGVETSKLDLNTRLSVVQPSSIIRRAD